MQFSTQARKWKVCGGINLPRPHPQFFENGSNIFLILFHCGFPITTFLSPSHDVAHSRSCKVLPSTHSILYLLAFHPPTTHYFLSSLHSLCRPLISISSLNPSTSPSNKYTNSNGFKAGHSRMYQIPSPLKMSFSGKSRVR